MQNLLKFKFFSKKKYYSSSLYSIAEPLSCIVDLCSEESKNKFLIAYSEIMKALEGKTKRSESIIQSEKTKEYILKYGTKDALPQKEIEGVEIKASEIEMKNYISIFNQNGKNYTFFVFNIFFCKIWNFLNFKIFL